MLIPFLALQQHILSVMPTILTCRIWNNNVLNLLGGTDAVYALPAVFIQFPEDIQWDQLGNGIQIVDPLRIKFHLIHDFYDAQDGTQDQNLEVLQLADTLRNTLQDWMPTSFTINSTDQFYSKYAGTYTLPFGCFQRINEKQDNDHGNVYHFIQEYLTTWTDSARNRPINGYIAGDLGYELDEIAPWDGTYPYLKGAYVTFNGGIYQALLDAVAPPSDPTNTTYWKYITKI